MKRIILQYEQIAKKPVMACFMILKKQDRQIRFMSEKMRKISSVIRDSFR